MGVDFIEVCAKQFQKTWDRGLRELSQPNLFTDTPREQRQLFTAHPLPGRSLTTGICEVALEDDELVVKSGFDTVARFHEVPQFAIEKIRKAGCGSAVGHVHRVHKLSGAADVTLR